MKTWKVPVYWSMTGTVEVTANTMKEAIDQVNRNEVALPAGKYVDGSFMADDGDPEMIRTCYNANQPDTHPAHKPIPPYYRPEVTEPCPHCDSVITLIWTPEEDGYQIHCPRCGTKIMLCSMCPMQNKCDWKSDFDGNEHCSMMDRFFKVEVIETSRKTVFIRAGSSEEAEEKAYELCPGMDLEYVDETMDVTVDSDYTGHPYTGDGVVIIE